MRRSSFCRSPLIEALISSSLLPNPILLQQGYFQLNYVFLNHLTNIYSIHRLLMDALVQIYVVNLILEKDSKPHFAKFTHDLDFITSLSLF